MSLYEDAIRLSERLGAGPNSGDPAFDEASVVLDRIADRMCRDCEGDGFVRNPRARYSEEISCPKCGGIGFGPPKQPRLCERCQGNGEIVNDWDRYLAGESSEPDVIDECPDCSGTGRQG